MRHAMRPPCRYIQSNTQTNPAFCPPPMVTKTQEYLNSVLGGAGKNEEAAQVLRE